MGERGDLVSLSKDLAVSESGFLFDPKTGLTYTLNSTGLFIFKKLQSGAPPGAIVEELMDEFDVDRRVAQEDLQDFLQQLRDLEVVKEG